MGKIIVSENATLDGVIQDPAGDEGFRAGGWVGLIKDSPPLNKLALDEALGAEALLLGRRSYEWFAARWPSRSGELADRLNSMPKYVVSSVLGHPAWNNSTVLQGGVLNEVAKLKQMLDGDIVVPASFQLVRTLLEHGLVDELRLKIFPVVLGAGERLFGETSDSTPVRLVGIQTIEGGIAFLTYRKQTLPTGNPRRKQVLPTGKRSVGDVGQFRGTQRIGPVPGRGRDHVTLPDVPDRPEAVPGQQGRHRVRREQREPGLAPLGGRLADQVRVGIARGVSPAGRQHVVDDHFGAGRESAEHRHGPLDGAGVQVHGATQPADERGFGGVESGPAQAVTQRVPGEVDRDERQAVGRRPNPALVVLGGRVVDLEHLEAAGQRRPVRERVQASAEDDVLAHPAPNRAGQTVFGVAAPAGDLRPGPGQHRMRPVRPVVLDELLGSVAQHGPGQGVGEDRRVVVDDQVRGPCRRGHECGQARLSISSHGRKITASHTDYSTK